MSKLSNLNPEKKETERIVNMLRERHESERGYVTLLADRTSIPRDRIYQWMRYRGLPRLSVAKTVLQAMNEIDNMSNMTYTSTLSSPKAAKTSVPEQQDPIAQKVATLEKEIATLKAQLEILIRLQSGK